MGDIVDILRSDGEWITAPDGRTYWRSTSREDRHKGADEIVKLRAQIEDACKVFEKYDLPEHALHYRRVALGMSAQDAINIHQRGEG